MRGGRGSGKVQALRGKPFASCLLGVMTNGGKRIVNSIESQKLPRSGVALTLRLNVRSPFLSDLQWRKCYKLGE
jgi:hypothetical protein